MKNTLIIVLGCLLAAATAAAGEVVEKDGIVHVRNPATPPGGVRTVVLEEQWRIGDADDDLLLGLPTGLGCDDAGRIYVLDAQLNQVHVLSPDGELLATRSRGGEGPGEMQNPSDLVVWPDGCIGVVQEFPGTVVRLDADGNPRPSLHPGGRTDEGGWGVLVTGSAWGDDGIVICGQMTSQDASGEPQRRRYLTLFDAAGVPVQTLMEDVSPPREGNGPMREREVLPPWTVSWDVAADGRVAVSMAWDRFRIFLSGSDARLDRVIEKEGTAVMRTDADRDFMLGLFGITPGAPPPVELADTEPVVSILLRGVQFAADGSLWVLTSEAQRNVPAGVLARFDVYDREGHFREQVDVRCEGNPRNDRLALLPDGRMIRQRRFVDAFVTSLGPGALPPSERADEDATPAVICYRVVE